MLVSLVDIYLLVKHAYLVGGWTNPFENYYSKTGSFPHQGVKKKMKPPPSSYESIHGNCAIYFNNGVSLVGG